MKRSPATYRRIATDAVLVAVIEITSAYVFAHLHLAEHLLAPGSGSHAALAATAMFLLFRGFALVLAPGWLLARAWLCWTGRLSANR